MRGPGGITRRRLASLTAGALASLLLPLGGCGASPAGDPGDAWRVIDSNGDWVGAARFSDADKHGFASNGLAAVQDAETELWGYVDESGRWVIGPTFRETREFAPNGLAPAQDDWTGLWGYVDELGKWTIAPQFANAWPFYDNGTAAVLDESGHDIVWLDGEGNELEGLTDTHPRAVMDPETRLFGIMALDGTWTCGPAFTDLKGDGRTYYLLARPQGSGLCGVVDAGGSWVVGPAYADLVVAFDAGVLAAKDPETGLWGYVGWDGGWVVGPRFADATRMGDDGRALARMP
ncbi:WG repeat-containing protein [Olsenella uli]|uniref:WG repeat-containing protein n=1 Tax=Olsenella uli TaxID=133926 RepID=UPI00241DC4DD|nr:WG repeat-containing protein [Olsenella uli]